MTGHDMRQDRTWKAGEEEEEEEEEDKALQACKGGTG